MWLGRQEVQNVKRPLASMSALVDEGIAVVFGAQEW